MEAFTLPVNPLQERQNLVSLTRKDIEILPHLISGLTIQQIGEKLGMHYDTIAKRRARLYKRLKVNDRMDLIRFAASEGIHYRNSMGEHKCFYLSLQIVQK